MKAISQPAGGFYFYEENQTNMNCSGLKFT
jgi:hypothetical protein